MIKVGIAGAAGYTGGELIRLMLHHPEVSIDFLQSKSQHGKLVSSVHQDLIGETDLTFSDEWKDDIQMLFLCAGHGIAKNLLSTLTLPEDLKIIDLSQDFRLRNNNTAGARTFIYGLPELNKTKIASASNIANPGCFATALQLGLLPLVAHGFAGPVCTTGITGATGAGQALNPNSHFAWRSNNIQAYKSLTHQHLREIEESMQQLHPDHEYPKINFIPWRGDFARGIFVSQQLQTDLSCKELNDLYKSYYADHPFTIISEAPIHLKQVINTNKCLVNMEQHEGQTVIHTAIDNLLKGAAGQAIQNMNLMFGLEETTGLKLKAGYF